jgi:homogentisate 1,2-dioxygenase
MFESRWRMKPTAFALSCAALDPGYAGCWAALADRFPP